MRFGEHAFGRTHLGFSTALFGNGGKSTNEGVSNQMRKIGLLLLSAATALVLMLAIAGPGFSAPKECSAGDPGCKTVSTTEETHDAGASPGFDVTETETQRGNTNAKGTDSTEETTPPVCTGPSGNVLDPSHPQCQ
jgi:hypothetical protein